MDAELRVRAQLFFLTIIYKYLGSAVKDPKVPFPQTEVSTVDLICPDHELGRNGGLVLKAGGSQGDVPDQRVE